LNSFNRHIHRSGLNNAGLTLIELMISILIFGIIMTVMFSVFSSTNRLYQNVQERADMQMNSRTAIEVLAQEIRSVGSDPTRAGLGGIMIANTDTIRVQSDLNGDGAIQTTEPAEDVTYYFDPGTETLFRDPGTGPQIMVEDVSVLTFTYFNAADVAIAPVPLVPDSISKVRSIGINIVTQSRLGGQVNYSTRIALRNL
jgi:prepilin-type N-terminal cleavage/methylation domain-containing protein